VFVLTQSTAAKVTGREGAAHLPSPPRDRLAEFSGGFSRQRIAQAVHGLDWDSHETLFVDVRRQLARTVAPARTQHTMTPREHGPRET
jgi:hypothetical protein